MVNVALDKNGVIYGTTPKGGIWKRGSDNASWETIPGCGSDISIAQDGTLFTLDKSDGSIYVFNSATNSWTKINDAGTRNRRIDALDKDTIVYISSNGKIFTNLPK